MPSKEHEERKVSKSQAVSCFQFGSMHRFPYECCTRALFDLLVRLHRAGQMTHEVSKNSELSKSHDISVIYCNIEYITISPTYLLVYVQCVTRHDPKMRCFRTDYYMTNCELRDGSWVSKARCVKHHRLRCRCEKQHSVLDL